MSFYDSSGYLVNPQKINILNYNNSLFPNNINTSNNGEEEQPKEATKKITLFITISPWKDTQQIEVADLNTEIGDISVFFKEKGTVTKIRNLRNYSLFKPLENSFPSTSSPTGSSVGNSSPFFSHDNNNNNNIDSNSGTPDSNSSKSNSGFEKKYNKKKRLLLSNDQSLLSYNIKDEQRLELLQNFNKNNESLPRWFYKVIVPSNQLEGILKEINTDSQDHQHHHHHRHDHHKFQRLNTSPQPSESFQHINSNNQPNISDIIENIKSNRMLTIDLPKRSTLTSSSGNTISIQYHNQNSTQSPIASSSVPVPSGKWSKASPTVPIRKNSLLDHDYDNTLLQYSSSIAPHLEWLHARKVYDVVCKIESEFPNILDSRLIDTSSHDEEDKWESRISSSEDTFIKSLTMEDTLGGEIVKQEYLEFSLRFENRTSILIGIEYSFVIWIDPIQTFFTLTCSGNATVRDVYFLILQYLFPTDQSEANNTTKIYEPESFSLMAPYFGFYLQETTSRSIPLQHKQLLINCCNHNSNSYESFFIFKRNHKKNISNMNPYNNSNSNTNSFSTSPNSMLNEALNSSNSSNNNTTSIDEDEGYNLTVLFPSHQTYRQFHFIPSRTVNETIQTIIQSTTKSLTFKNSSNSSNNNNISSNNNQFDQKNSIFNNSSFKSILSFSPTLMSSNLNNPNPSNQNNNTSSSNSSSNMIFENLDETQGFCLYFQKDGSGVWMEGNRRLTSYNLPNETLVEFKPPPMVCKLALIEGINHTIKLVCKLKAYTIVYGKYTLISQLEDLIAQSIEPGNEKEFESYGLFLVRGNIEIFISNHINFQDIYEENSTPLASDYLEFKPSSSTTIDSVLKDAALAFANPKEPILLPGETQIIKRDGERIVSGQPKKGSFIITNYRLIFTALNRSSYDDLTKDDIEFPITSVLKMKHNSNMFTEIHSKDFKFCIFHCRDITLWSILKNIVEIQSITKTFAFTNLELYDKSLDTIYNPFEEFQRLQFPLDKFRMTHCNSEYNVCPSYPSLFIVPLSIKDEDLKKIANFREKGRIPAICWIHKNHNSTITRCSQPRVGLARARCSEDEEYLKIIKQSNSNSQILYVMDSRPMANAKANTLLGKGHENTSLYQNVELKFLGIGNIHVMRDSFKKLYSLMQSPETDNWLPLIDGTQWLEHIYQLINSANMVVELVDKKGTSVLTHCSDGWDRTSQLVALSQLLLDPYYRTIKGFQILIEKEWLSFGHLFTNRTAHVHNPNGDDDFSPIFLMFIDSVWQLTCLLPTTFQFNEAFLIKIMDSVYNCRYKQFLFNNERERLFYSRHTNNIGLVSLWPSINSNLELYTNYFYIKNPKPIYENFFMCDIQFWSNYYLRWNEKFKPKVQIDFKVIKEIEEIKLRKERKRQSNLTKSKDQIVQQTE